MKLPLPFTRVLMLVLVVLARLAKQQILVEKCWASKPVCEFSGLRNTQGDIYCWERCLCKGKALGTCEKTPDCTVPGYPWKCTCKGTQQENAGYNADRCRKHLKK